MGSEIFWAIFSVLLYSFFSFATGQCLIFLLQDNEKKREKFLTAKYGAHQVGLVSDQMLPEKTSPKIGPSRCARFVFVLVILCNTL